MQAFRIDGVRAVELVGSADCSDRAASVVLHVVSIVFDARLRFESSRRTIEMGPAIDRTRLAQVPLIEESTSS